MLWRRSFTINLTSSYSLCCVPAHIRRDKAFVPSFMVSKSIPEISVHSFQSWGNWRIIRIEAIVLQKKKERKENPPRSMKCWKGHLLVNLSLLVLPIILRGPVEVIALGEHEAFQVPVLRPLLQSLLLQYGHQSVSFLHRPHYLRQDLLLLLQFGGALFCVCRQRGKNGQVVYFQLMELSTQWQTFPLCASQF